jgi:hypothetical protein
VGIVAKFRGLPLWMRLAIVAVAVAVVVALAIGAKELAAWLLFGGGSAVEGARRVLGARRAAEDARQLHDVRTTARNTERESDQDAAEWAVGEALEDTIDTIPPVDDDDRDSRSFGSPWD